MKLEGQDKVTLTEEEFIKAKLGDLTSLIRHNRAKFVYSLTNMLGLDLKVIVHRLNIDPNTKVMV